MIVTVIISINAIIFYKYMIDEVYCENRTNPENIIFALRMSAIRITESGPCLMAPLYVFDISHEFGHYWKRGGVFWVDP